MKRAVILLSFLTFSIHFVFTQQAQEMLRPDLGERVGTCDACGMDVFDNMLTKVEITADGETFFACGMGCAFAMTEGKRDVSMKVVDFNTVSMIDAAKAYYVTGSLLTPVRAMMPLFVFATENEAMSFMEKYGGIVHDYGGLEQLAKRIREERRR
jgi:nitrous oxide reductase accessory protein NosL